MPLSQYGVLIGTFNRFEREAVDSYGNWYHGFVHVNIPGKVYKCAVDVFKPDGGFEFMLLGIDEMLFAPINSLPNGYHILATNPTTGAIDYVRSPVARRAIGCRAILVEVFNWLLRRHEKLWYENTGTVALDELDNLVSDATRIFVFGEPFHNNNPTVDGMHDVHMNQGDPPGQFYHLNGIWQDGCIIVRKPNGNLRGYFAKFKEQSLSTDNNGNPI